MQQRNIFAGAYLDRAAHLREDAERFAAALADERSRAIPVWNSRNLIAEGDTPRAAYLELSGIPAEQRNGSDLILLGRFEDTHFFTYEIESVEPPSLAPGTRFEDLRLVAWALPMDEAGLLGYARAIISWRRRHRFCGTCGAKTVSAKSGHVLVCSDPSCRNEQFPRIDPAIIVLVSDGERALLGRQASWPIGRYSTIAGFVEPGESLEDAVAREVFEETGIEVEQIEYHSSQPWPFPASLMLGFTARATTSEVHLRDQELEDARWFTRAEIESGGVLLPPKQSISFRLIEDWFDAGGQTRLRDIQGSTPWPRSR
jgi:NAD+ diphosphatase